MMIPWVKEISSISVTSMVTNSNDWTDNSDVSSRGIINEIYTSDDGDATFFCRILIAVGDYVKSGTVVYQAANNKPMGQTTATAIAQTRTCLLRRVLPGSARQSHTHGLTYPAVQTQQLMRWFSR